MNTERIKSTYNKMLKVLDLVNLEYPTIPRELDSQISSLYTDIKKDLDALATT